MVIRLPSPFYDTIFFFAFSLLKYVDAHFDYFILSTASLFAFLLPYHDFSIVIFRVIAVYVIRRRHAFFFIFSLAQQVIHNVIRLPMKNAVIQMILRYDAATRYACYCATLICRITYFSLLL